MNLLRPSACIWRTPARARRNHYEGTETMQTLIVGRDITGVAAFA
jgi:hypothetical protein